MDPVVQPHSRPQMPHRPGQRPHRPGDSEWPTWLVVFLVHSAWLGLLAGYHALGPALAAPLLGVVLTWHSSLCHELLHGHPTRSIWLNDLLGQLPLALMVPYFTFKESHLRHHRNDHITLPGIDPESYFIRSDLWRSKGAWGRRLAWFNMTFVGRMLLGPGIAFLRLAGQMGRELRARRWGRITGYAIHFALATAIVLLAQRWFQVPPWQYLIIAYLSQSLLLMRAYFEHRPHRETPRRTVIMETCRPLQLLYLNNNLHAVHHRYPDMPWYHLPREYRRNRDRYLQDNGHFHYRGYRAWLRYLFKPVASPVHPFSGG